jgi:hypothetical protein
MLLAESLFAQSRRWFCLAGAFGVARRRSDRSEQVRQTGARALPPGFGIDLGDCGDLADFAGCSCFADRDAP